MIARDAPCQWHVQPVWRCAHPEPLLGMGAPWSTTPCARVTCQSGAPWEWVPTDATWASPAGNPASVQQPTCLGQKCTHLPQPACEVTEVYYSVNKNSSKPLLLEISLFVPLNCHSNLCYFDFEREINKQTSFTILAEIWMLSSVKLSALEFTNLTFVIINRYIWHPLPRSVVKA